MGTNFFHYEKPACPTCGHYDGEPRHIGKSSAGWCFSLRVYPDEGINGLEDWLARFSTGVIRDEYKTVITPDEMRKRITERGWKKPEERNGVPYGYASWDQFYEHNHAQAGPNGLLRPRIDMRHCLGHGEGTWDLIVGDFS